MNKIRKKREQERKVKAAEKRERKRPGTKLKAPASAQAPLLTRYLDK